MTPCHNPSIYGQRVECLALPTGHEIAIHLMPSGWGVWLKAPADIAWQAQGFYARDVWQTDAFKQASQHFDSLAERLHQAQQASA